MSVSMRASSLSLALGFLVLTGCQQSKFKGSNAADKAPVVPTPLSSPAVPATPKPTPVTLVETTIVAKPETIPSKNIEFGANEIFRIGDGFASATSACVGQVNTFKLSGTTYYFQFEVMEDDTNVDLSIGRICGVDQLEKDTFSLINEGTREVKLVEKPLPKLTDVEQAQPWVPYPQFKLAKGIYSVVIASKNILGHAKVPGAAIDPSKDEYDDFLVGNILLKANKNVKSLKIYTE